MDIRIVQFLAFVALVQSRDVIVGENTDGSKIFDETKEASPALWRQSQNVTVNASDSEIISRVVITDLRPDKDGDAKIVEGGEGQKNVTIELKSPTVLRGYEFHIEVYAIPDKNSATDVKNDGIPHPSVIGKDTDSKDVKTESNFDHPRTNLDGITTVPDYTNAPSIPLATNINFKEETRKVRNTNDKEEQSTTPVFDSKSKSISLAETSSTTAKTYQSEATTAKNDGSRPKETGKEFHNNEKTSTTPAVQYKTSENYPHKPTTSEKEITNHGSSKYIRDTHKADEPNHDDKNVQNSRFIPLNIGKHIDSTTKIPEANDKTKNNQDNTNEQPIGDKHTFAPLTPDSKDSQDDSDEDNTFGKIDNTKSTTVSNIDIKFHPTTEKPRNSRDTGKEDKKDHITPRTLDSNKKINNDDFVQHSPALLGQNKGLSGPLTPENDQEAKQSMTENTRKARDSIKEENKDHTIPAILNNGKFNTNDNTAKLATASVGQSRDLHGLPTTAKFDQHDKSTAEKPRNARDAIKEDSKYHTTAKTPENSSLKTNTNNFPLLTPTETGQANDMNVNHESNSTLKIDTHDSKVGFEAQNSDAAKTLGPYTVPISFKLHSSTEAPKGLSTTEKSETILTQNKRDADIKHADETKDAQDKNVPKLPRMFGAYDAKETNKDVEMKPVISIQ